MNTKPLLMLACAAGIPAGCAHAQPKPNVVIIFMDDMGYGDLTVTGASGYQTPNIDRLCTEGMRFTNFYSAQAVSSASRAGLMTGCYPNRLGISGALFPQSKVGLNPQEETMAEMLKKSGYACSIVGKWHLGDAPAFLPTNNGFDEYFGLPYSNDMWRHHPENQYYNFDSLPLMEGTRVINPDVTASDLEQITTQYTERAVNFIRKQKKNQPFFLYMAHTMPHVPLYVSSKFKGKSQQGLYGDVMMEIDWNVGEILKALKETGADKNTLVIFTSDNGPWIGYGNHAGSTGGLREAKGSSFEGGQRVPCIMRWPGVIQAGVICNQLSSTIDLFPTLAEITRAPLPERKIDGVSILPLLKQVPGAAPRQYFLYYFRQNNLEAVRNHRFKLILPHPSQTHEGFLPGNDGKPGDLKMKNFPQALYDLRMDPGERYDVQSLYPEVVAELMGVAEEARRDLGDDLTKNPGQGRREPGRIQ